MKTYAGSNLRHRALIVLAENPIREGAVPAITVYPDMGEIHVFFTCANLSYLVHGTLPMADLPAITEALTANMVLQQNFAAAKERQLVRNFEADELGRKRDELVATTIAGLPGLSDHEVQSYRAAAREEFAPAFERLRQARLDDLALAEPGPAAFPGNVIEYICSIDARAEERSGISADAEAQLLGPAEQWENDWSAFISAGSFNAQQLLMVRAMRAQASNRIVLTPEKLANGPLARIGNAYKIFPISDLAKCVAFSNEMAYKAAPFLDQATSAWLDDEQHDEADTLTPGA